MNVTRFHGKNENYTEGLSQRKKSWFHLLKVFVPRVKNSHIRKAEY